jgi:putative membrane protein
MKTYLSIYGAAAMAALLTTSLSAADLAKSDEAFMKKAASGGMAEVKLGEVAKEKGSRKDVKDFGAMMAGDHGKANEELKSLAQKKGVTLPPGPTGKHEAAVNKLSKLSGEEFDKAYIDEMVKDHENAVKEFEQVSGSAKDADVKAFATKTLPTLKTHLERIRAIKGGAK